MADQGSELFNAMRAGSYVHAAKEAAAQQFLYRQSPSRGRAARQPVPAPAENVLAVGVGEKVTKGISTGIPAVKLLVRVKFANELLSASDRLPQTINGVPVDVEEIGAVRALKLGAPVRNPRSRLRPAQPGCSVGFFDPISEMTGTFGAVVTRDGKTFILSNNHVLANDNQSPIGSPILQPGMVDGGRLPGDEIGRLAQFVALKPTGNRVDAAIAGVADPKLVSPDILSIGPPAGTKEPAFDMIVQKFGRTTGYRAGRVTSVGAIVKVEYDSGAVRLFEEQIFIQGLNGEQFSGGGDSGSLILERPTNKAVGLLFAGSPTHSIANTIRNVLTELKVALV